MTDSITPDQYGVGDASYRAVGELAGITRLVNRFYDLMDQRADAKNLRAMHAADLTRSREKLAVFLAGWMGGPNLYAERFGALNLPMAHSHLPIDRQSEQSWLDCMAQAMTEQDYPEALKAHLLKKFAVPAESMRLMAEFKRTTATGAGLFHDAS